jgi:biopolymer transport protein ExbD
MTQPLRFLDVWIVESNTVYREVPFTVVTDWLQQGRLLESDKARPSGQGEWKELKDFEGLSAYLPRREDNEVDDAAQALEDVSMDLAWKRPGEDDDQDVDMIPLIDVSLVLLIFFMMTSTVAGLGGAINVPQAAYGSNASFDPLWIGIEFDKDKTPVYSIGQGAGGAIEGDANLTQATVLDRLDSRLKDMGRIDQLNIRADKNIPSGLVKQLRRELELRRTRGQISKIGDEVLTRASP